MPQSSSITGALTSDCLVTYPGHSLGVVLLLCREAVSVFYSPSQLGNTVVGNRIVGVLTCALLHSMCDLNSCRDELKNSLIQKRMLYKFKLDHNTIEATKNICCMIGNSLVDHSTVTKWLIAQSAGAVEYTDCTSAEW